MRLSPGLKSPFTHLHQKYSGELLGQKYQAKDFIKKIRVKNHAYEVKICAYEVHSCAYEVEICVL